MGWTEREAGAVVVLGDGEGQVRRVAGLLASVKQDPRYPDNRRFELVQKDGTSKYLAGFTALNSQLGQADVGHFVKIEFVGWEGQGGNRWKKPKVEVYEGEPTAEMRSYPRWRELNEAPKRQNVPVPNDEDVPPEELEQPDDDLPF